MDNFRSQNALFRLDLRVIIAQIRFEVYSSGNDRTYHLPSVKVLS